MIDGQTTVYEFVRPVRCSWWTNGKLMQLPLSPFLLLNCKRI